MKTYASAAFALALLVGLAITGRDTGGQSSAQIGGAPLTHIGVVVPDIAAAARVYVDVFGVPMSEVRTIALELPNKSKVDVDVASMSLPNFRIELHQPVSKSGPIHDHLQRFGLGVHHVGFGIKDGLDEKRRFLEQRGGRWTAGAGNGRYAFLDFRETLGATIEVALQTASGTASATEAPSATRALGTFPMIHVGLAVRDADQAAKAYSDALGIPIGETRVIKPGYPPDSMWNRDAHVRLTSWKHENTAIELVAPIGAPSPWSESLEKQRGNMVQHLAFNVGDRLAEINRALETKGGKWTNGTVGGRSAYFDFAETLGLVIETIGTNTPTGNAQEGRTLWEGAATFCKQCHGVKGEGGFGPDLAGRRLSFGQFTRAVRRPWGIMPAFTEQQFSDQEAAHIMAYLATLPEVTAPGPWRIPIPTGAPPGQLLAIATVGCAQCHGAELQGPRTTAGGVGADFEWFKKMVYEHTTAMPEHWRLLEAPTARIRMGNYSRERLPESVLQEIWQFANDLGLRVPITARLSAGVREGTHVSYTLTVENAGLPGKGRTAEDMVVSLTLPSGSKVEHVSAPGYHGVRRESQTNTDTAVWQVSSLAPKVKQTFTITLSSSASGGEGLRGGSVRWSKPPLGNGNPSSVNIAPPPAAPPAR